MVRLAYDDDGTHLDPVIQIDHVLVGHPDAAGGDRRADIFRLVGAVYPEQGVLAAGVQIQRARTHRIVRSRRHEVGNAEPLDLALGRMPGRPLGHAADLGDAGPCHGFFADGNAVADRLAVVEHVIKIVIVGIDQDRAGRFLAVIIDNGAAERLGDGNVGVANLGQQFLVARFEVGLIGCFIGRALHAARQHQARGQDSQFQLERRHGALPIEILASARAYCAPTATIQLSPLSWKSAIIPELRCLSRAAADRLCLFCRKFSRFRLFFVQSGAVAESAPRCRHKWTGRLTRRHQALARIELSPVGWTARPAPEPSMLSVYVPSESSLKKVAEPDLAALPENTVWIDLVKPTAAEDKAVERLAGIAVPTREDMQEIEISSRLYIENSARYMTATLMCASDTQNPRTTAVTFILSSRRLVTVRYDDPKPFMLVENKLARSCPPAITGKTVRMDS